MTEEELKILNRCVKALEAVVATGATLKALNFVLKSLEELTA